MRRPTRASRSLRLRRARGSTGVRSAGLSRWTRRWRQPRHPRLSAVTRMGEASSGPWRQPRGGRGTGREIVPESVKDMDIRFPSTFNSYDYDNHRVVIAPHSPCPILFGIRGDEPGVLPEAMRSIRGERPAGWLLFETNQGTDDHVVPQPVMEPRQTIRVEGRVERFPRILRGGHVVVSLSGVDVTAYEPSKQFRSVVAALWPGDRIGVIGAIRDEPRTLNLEKLQVLDVVSRVVKIANPTCSACGCRAKSMGRMGLFRCPKCREKFPRFAASFRTIDSGLRRGWYEPPVGSRRHLSKPLKRF